MITLSLLINIVVLIPVCALLFYMPKRAGAVYGGKTPARGILAAIYLSILVLSAAMLVDIQLGTGTIVAPYVTGLLLIQVIYKVLTVWTVGLRNPVVISNVVIAVIHGWTLTQIWF